MRHGVTFKELLEGTDLSSRVLIDAEGRHRIIGAPSYIWSRMDWLSDRFDISSSRIFLLAAAVQSDEGIDIAEAFLRAIVLLSNEYKEHFGDLSAEDFDALSEDELKCELAKRYTKRIVLRSRGGFLEQDSGQTV